MNRNYMDLPARLRATESRSKRALLDEAADVIEALLADLKTANTFDNCCACKYIDAQVDCAASDCNCALCKEDCACKNCRNGGKWEWRGPKGRATK